MSNLNYTDLDSSSIQAGLDEAFSQNVSLTNYKDSSNMKRVTDAVKAMVDINNYNIERRAEEAYPDTAVLDDSAIGMANLLGYSVRQPKPALSHITITVRGGFIGQSEVHSPTNSIISFKKWFKVIYNDIPFVFRSGYIIELTPTEFNSLKLASTVLTFDKSRQIVDGNIVQTNELIDITQGEFKEVIFNGSDQKGYFQVFEIEDTTFSDYFGTSDINYSDKVITDAPSTCYDIFHTYVGVKKVNDNIDVAKANPYYIDRRSLSRYDLQVEGGFLPKVCMIRARREGGVDVLFGGGKDQFDVEDVTNYSFSGGFSQRASQEVLVKYFSTLGSSVNRSDVIGKRLNLLDDVYIGNSSTSISSYITVTFNRSIYNGTDRENKDSIKINAPASFSSGGRLVTREDYRLYLKGKSIEGKKIYGAVAWGENEEVKSRRVRAIKELANRTLFSVISSLYEKDNNSDWNYVKEIDKAIIETLEEYENTYSVKENDLWLIPLASSPFVASYMTDDYFGVKETPSVNEWTEEMDSKSMMTIVNKYVTPIIRKVKLEGDVYIGSAENTITVSKKIKNSLYKYFDTVCDYKKKIMISNVNSIIEDNTSVRYIRGLKFVPNSGAYEPNISLDKDSINGTVKVYTSDIAVKAQVLSDIYNVFGDMGQPTGIYTGTAEEIFDKKFENYVSSHWLGMTYDNLVSLHKLLFSSNGLPYLNTLTKMSGRTLDSHLFSLFNTINKWCEFTVPTASEVLRYDLYTLYGNLYCYFESMLSANLIDDSGVVNYNNGNEIVQVEVNLNYKYGQ